MKTVPHVPRVFGRPAAYLRCGYLDTTPPARLDRHYPEEELAPANLDEPIDPEILAEWQIEEELRRGHER